MLAWFTRNAWSATSVSRSIIATGRNDLLVPTKTATGGGRFFTACSDYLAAGAAGMAGIMPIQAVGLKAAAGAAAAPGIVFIMPDQVEP